MRWNNAFSSVDAQVAGHALRLITFGAPRLSATSVREQYAEMRDHYDHIRHWLLSEPRGYSGMTGAILQPSMDPDVDYGVVFMTAGGYSPLSGHGVISLATALIETGTLPIDGPEVRITFDTFVGHIQARATVDKGIVRGVRFRNVPSFRLMKDLQIEVEGRDIAVDIAFGGNWYAVVSAESLGLSLDVSERPKISRLGAAILRAATNAMDVVHPEDPDLAGLLGTVIHGVPQSEDAVSRNATVYRGGQIDRSPSATGMAATMACLAAEGQLRVGSSFMAESMIDTVLSGRLVVDTRVGEHPAIITEIAGRGSVTGMHQFFVDPVDTQVDPGIAL